MPPDLTCLGGINLKLCRPKFRAFVLRDALVRGRPVTPDPDPCVSAWLAKVRAKQRPCGCPGRTQAPDPIPPQ